MERSESALRLAIVNQAQCVYGETEKRCPEKRVMIQSNQPFPALNFGKLSSNLTIIQTQICEGGVAMLQTLRRIYARLAELLELPYMVIGIISGILVICKYLSEWSAT